MNHGKYEALLGEQIKSVILVAEREPTGIALGNPEDRLRERRRSRESMS
jgi:hypothetical protein